MLSLHVVPQQGGGSVVPVNRTWLPPRDEYAALLDDVWADRWVTNGGPLARRLERQLERYLGVRHVRLVANGTMALQLGLRALDIDGDVITTPFSYVATTTALLWERCRPVFADIDPDTLTLDPEAVSAAVTPRTRAILPTHVFGNACDLAALRTIAERHGLRILYDAAHAFGAAFDGRSLLAAGDATAVSFHATKLYHTVEGGAVVTDDDGVAERVELLRAFGHRRDVHHVPGIDAKMSELHAAMGLCLLPRVDAFVAERRRFASLYRTLLDGLPLRYPRSLPPLRSNAAYFPVLFDSPRTRAYVQRSLEGEGILTRRYFSPSLNRLPYVDGGACPIAERAADTVLCLPFFQDITADQIERVSSALRRTLEAVA